MLLLGLAPLLVGVGQLDDGTAETRLARDAIVAEVQGTPPPKLPDLGSAKPVFVTIEREGRVLGCRGDLVTRFSTLAQEIAAAARSACAHDPRYRPLHAAELGGMSVTVTLVQRLEPLTDALSLRPEDGLVLRSGDRVGVVLPWEGKDPNVRLRWAYQKAGVKVGSGARLERMIAERWRS